MDPTNTSENHAWSQQPGEPDKAHAHFTRWLTLKDRAFTAASQRLKISVPYIAEMSSKYKWQSRAAAYDQHRAWEISEATAKDRMAAARAIALDILECVQARQLMCPEERDTAGIQRLAAALKAITPSLEHPAASFTVSAAGTGTADAVTIAVKRAQELERDDDSE